MAYCTGTETDVLLGSEKAGAPKSCLSGKLGVSVPSVSESISRGQGLADDRGCYLLEI